MDTRTNARLVLVGPDHSLLMMLIHADDGRETSEQIWVTLGGGVESGESIMDAAERELFEETRITDAEIGPVVWHGEQVLRRHGSFVHATEYFVLVRARERSLSTVGWSESERKAIAGLRWWSIEELRATEKVIKPPEFVNLVEPLLHSEPQHCGPKRITLSG